MGKRRGAYRNFRGRPDGKRQLGRTKRRWKDDDKMDLQEVEWGGTDRISLIQDKNRWWAIVNAVIDLWVS